MTRYKDTLLSDAEIIAHNVGGNTPPTVMDGLAAKNIIFKLLSRITRLTSSDGDYAEAHDIAQSVRELRQGQPAGVIAHAIADELLEAGFHKGTGLGWVENEESNYTLLMNLSEGTYHDGTYEWDFDGEEWTPLMAPDGMPSHPRYQGLHRVVKTRVPVQP